LPPVSFLAKNSSHSLLTVGIFSSSLSSSVYVMRISLNWKVVIEVLSPHVLNGFMSEVGFTVRIFSSSPLPSCLSNVEDFELKSRNSSPLPFCFN